MKKIEISICSVEIKELINKDPLFEPIVKKSGSITLYVDNNYFHALISAIIAQQLSSKVAQVIEKRVYQYFSSEITTNKIIEANEEELRKLGLSRPKIKYLKSLAHCIENKDITFDNIEDLSDNEIISMLVQAKGVGIWTAQMFLIFAMGRMDVFSSLDLGLRNAVKMLYENELLSKDEIESISKKWTPYRTIASLYLWRLIE